MMISNNIRHARARKGMSQAQLALALGVKENTVWRWENNKSTPSARIIVDIARILDSTPTELLPMGTTETSSRQIIQQEQSPADFSYWGGILNETRNAINRGDAREISLIETFLNSAREMITDSKNQVGTTTQAEKSSQHFDIHDNTMEAENINMGTVPVGASAQHV